MPMTADTIRAHRAEMKLTADQFAVVVGASGGRTIRKWESGKRPVPQPVQNLMMVLDYLKPRERTEVVGHFLAKLKKARAR